MASTQPRGLRNNNPGNLRITSIPWVGKLSKAENTDGAFEQFRSLKWGLRAMILDVRSKISKGLDTIEKLLSVYAPKLENDTANYARIVAQRSGLKTGQRLTATKEVLSRLVLAMIRVENGITLSQADFESGWGVLRATSHDAAAPSPGKAMACSGSASLPGQATLSTNIIPADEAALA